MDTPQQECICGARTNAPNVHKGEPLGLRNNEDDLPVIEKKMVRKFRPKFKIVQEIPPDIQCLIDAKLIYSHEAAHICGVTARQFRDIRTKFGLKPVAITPTGYYLFRADDIWNLRVREHLEWGITYIPAKKSEPKPEPKAQERKLKPRKTRKRVHFADARVQCSVCHTRLLSCPHSNSPLRKRAAS